MTSDNTKDEAALRDALHERQMKRFEAANNATVQTGTEYVKLAALINGGAIVASLTFIGVLLGKSGVAATDLKCALAGIASYALGVFVALISLGLGHLSNSASTSAISSTNLLVERPYLEPTEAVKGHTDNASSYGWWSRATGAVGAAAFLVGSVLVISGVWFALPKVPIPGA